MSFLSRKAGAIALGAVFAAVAAGGLAYEHQQANAATTYDVCVDNLLIPQTLEQAEYLKHHAAEAYAALDNKPVPQDSPLVASFIADLEKGGKTATVTGFNPNGSTSILPDGTKRPVGCYVVNVK